MTIIDQQAMQDMWKMFTIHTKKILWLTRLVEQNEQAMTHEQVDEQCKMCEEHF